MPLTLKVVTPPTDEPIALAHVKTFLRVDGTDQDTILLMNMVAARSLVETKSRRQLMPATLKRSLDFFPGNNWNQWRLLHPRHEEQFRSHAHRLLQRAIELPRPPAVSVSSIKYIDSTGTQQTLDPSQYRVDVDSEPGRIEPAFSCCWPYARPVVNAIEITYVAGYADQASVPAEAKQAILLLLSHWYEHREAVVPGASATQMSLPVALAFDALVDSFAVPYLGEECT